MKKLKAILAPSALVLAALLIGTTGAAQGEKPPVLPEDLIPRNDAQQELIDLFHKVERNLERIDSELADAGAGALPLGAVEESGLDDLLRSAQQRSQGVMRDIDRILQIAHEMGHGDSLGACAKPKPGQGQSPLDEERDTGPKGREETPDKPGQKPGDGQDEPQDGEEPGDSPKENQTDGDNQAGPNQNPSQGPPSDESQDADRWGTLPARYQETFRNQGADELPIQYRDWIDSYYRRLSQKNARRR